MTLSSTVFGKFDSSAAASLIKWYRENGTAYPWAESPDPWGIWVSEVMLQQTTVGAVEPRYRKWMDRFPTPESLAAANEDEVLREWEGLGYYNRARNLASAARELHLSYGGRVPREPEELQRLPGVGEYIAAAVASFAFGKRCAAIDANGRRIAMRLSASEAWNKGMETAFKIAVEAVMPEDNPGEMNAAMMQLGQKVCSSRSPFCGDCPLASICEARRQGVQNSIPARRRQEVILKKTSLVIFIDKNAVLLQKRSSGIGRGLWVFPSKPDFDELVTGCRYEETLDTQVHSYTKYRETLEPLIFRPGKGYRSPGIPADSGFQFVELDKLAEFPMPTAYRRIADQLGSSLAKTGQFRGTVRAMPCTESPWK